MQSTFDERVRKEKEEERRREATGNRKQEILEATMKDE